MIRALVWLSEFVRPCFIGGGSGGGGDAAAESRRLEDERQRRVNEGVGRVNAIFSGGKYGTGRQISPGEFSYGRQYYDRAGNPVTIAPQTEPLVTTQYREPNWMVNDPGGTAARTTQRAVSPAAYYASAFGGNPLFSDVGESEGYNDQFFDTIANDYLSYYRPQLDDQYARARRNALLNSPGRGSGRLRTLGELDTDYGRESVALGERAQGARAEAKRDVESNRAQLIRAAEAGSSPETVAMQATEASKYLRQPPAYEPLGDMFARTAQQVANAKAAQRQGYEWREPLLFNNNPSRKRGSAINVGG